MASKEAAYRLRPLAERDLERIWVYTLERWSLEQADRYLRMFVEAFADLAAGAKPGRPVDVRPGYFKHIVGSHVIYFTRIGDAIDIVRVLHGRMDVGRHL